MDWEDIANEFALYGLLCDLRIDETSLVDWGKAWSFLTRSDTDISFTIDGKPAALPQSVEEAFAIRKVHSVLASCVIDGIRYNCHFFDESVVEMDVDPHEIDSPEAAEKFTNFMTMLGRQVGKAVYMTPEGMPQYPIARFDLATSEVRWLPTSQ